MPFISKSRGSLLRPTFVEGSPDLVMEIVSPDSTVRDWQTEYIDYQRAGVCEYWVVDPLSRRVEAYTLRAGKYKSLTPEDRCRLQSKVIRG